MSTLKKTLPPLKRKRRTIQLDELVRRTVGDAETGLPLVQRVKRPGIDAPDWAQLQRETIMKDLADHGAVLFRGFPLENASDFQAFAQSMVPDLYGQYGDLPKEHERIYKSTPYPADRMILFHNESSHLKRFPATQMFFCVQPAIEGGCTPIADGCEVADRLGSETLARLRKRKLRYVRNFLPGLDVPWQDFFKTENRRDVEARCQEEGMTFEWLADDGLAIYNHADAVIDHPHLARPVFFNQIQLHHPECLEPKVREAMIDLYGEKRLPRNVTYGDGLPIESYLIKRIGEAYEASAKRFQWHPSDVLLLDNLRYSHARDPFSGKRKILVAMANLRQAPVS